MDFTDVTPLKYRYFFFFQTMFQDFVIMVKRKNHVVFLLGKYDYMILNFVCVFSVFLSFGLFVLYM